MGEDERNELEATAEQIDMLRELGVSERGLEGLTMAEAEDLIAELRAERQTARF